ncbi:hybrid sensor histidine kinase/response regulator [Pseudomonas lundensis]|jgi:signal transduction histidine kinase|uniref:hybrid sensor histidine kinase/response regulator n=1 Tax=Pseudomonas lundensis TaxID=86185 RepID=UPI000641C630|nr:hybrid sensor histidine kinase/response regulator [Pseudomonas lundensis]MBM1181490.1 hybrid sensor histidine kinase/response regulator [Pseudomonas lundensis]MCT8951352.1 hybrid sensor histidine kinase/response regulator [Pseudomonas lundensis]NNA24744.1 hybrid sensor histidine kinase/response regulator [Pseudomonas lundensis]NNA35702.1 hybrid sensor histidine kinase/response regulator [Pseudomonas lundensis]OZY37097.1 hybrid sensor histidine kinase/response regulator [Pseudomonas lundensi
MLVSDIQAKLLIVDDLPENLLALEALIKREDRAVYKALSADEALSLLLQHEFALAILDVQMPGMNGFELAEMMRGTEKTKNIPIVFVSAAGREMNYAFKGYESGAVDFLHKPLDIHAVKSKVNVFVDLYRQRKAVKQQVEALEQSRREQEVLLAQLQVTQGELEHAVRMRDDFMSIVSHEVRTPLNGLILETQLRKMHLARDNAAAFTLDKMQAMVERDERQIQSLIRLIEDMLDVSRIRTGKLSIRPGQFDLSRLVSTLVETFAPQISAAQSSVNLNAESPVVGLWDEFRIEQVVSNLLTNALRYGAKSPIDVSVYVEGENAIVEVRDQGIGISEENQQRIFQQFERVSAKHAVAGLGLGLFISEQIVAAHGGKITVQSALGEGAVFRVSLPLAQNA